MTIRCFNCGSPLAFDGKPSVKCPFCEAENAPPLQEVLVAVPVAAPSASAAAMPANVADRRCPHCRKRLASISTSGVTLSGCGACGGIWIDNASTRHVLADPEPIFSELSRRSAFNRTGARASVAAPTCAECPAILDRVETHGVDLDICADHGTWFDAFELGTLMDILRDEADARAQGKPVRAKTDVVCQACGTPIANGFGNVTDRGILCESCWRNETRELVEEADQTHNKRGGIAIGGALLGIGAVMLAGLGSSTKS